MSKYRVIELDDKTEYVMEIGTDSIGRAMMVTVSADDLEELNSDYINEYFGDLQDVTYQRGLDDAWEAAKKIVLSVDEGGLSVHNLSKIFGSESARYAFKKYSASEVIEKLKAYEEKQKAEDDIKVGDVVMIKQFKHPENHLFVVTKVSDESVWGVEGDGSWKGIFEYPIYWICIKNSNKPNITIEVL